jgi:hypothetical protein
LETLEALKKLKLEYERLRDQYFLTRSDLHYMQFQQGFKEYRSFIDRHNISPSEIESLMLMDLQECIKVVREIKEDTVPPKPSMRRIRAIGSEQKVLDFMSTRESFLPIEEISSHALLIISQTRRYLYQLHDRGHVERRYEGCRQLWRRKNVYD